MILRCNIYKRQPRDSATFGDGVSEAPTTTSRKTFWTRIRENAVLVANKPSSRLPTSTGINVIKVSRCGRSTSRLFCNANKNRLRHFPDSIAAPRRAYSDESSSYSDKTTARLLGKYL